MDTMKLHWSIVALRLWRKDSCMSMSAKSLTYLFGCTGGLVWKVHFMNVQPWKCGMWGSCGHGSAGVCWFHQKRCRSWKIKWLLNRNTFWCCRWLQNRSTLWWCRWLLKRCSWWSWITVLPHVLQYVAHFQFLITSCICLFILMETLRSITFMLNIFVAP